MKITKRELLFYVGIFVFISLFLLTSLSLDNLSWITASGEWNGDATVCNQLDCWTGAVKDYSFADKVDYVFRYRVYTVFTHPRDLIPISLIAFGITSFFILGREILFKGRISKKIRKWLQ